MVAVIWPASQDVRSLRVCTSSAGAAFAPLIPSLTHTLTAVLGDRPGQIATADALEVGHWIRLASLCVAAGSIKAVAQVAPLVGSVSLEQALQVWVLWEQEGVVVVVVVGGGYTIRLYEDVVFPRFARAWDDSLRDDSLIDASTTHCACHALLQITVDWTEWEECCSCVSNF